MGKIESFVYSCLPALLILVFSEVAVYLAEGRILLTMGILGLFYMILIWWLYEYTRGKVLVCNRETTVLGKREDLIEEDKKK